MTEEQAVEAYAKFALSGKALTPEGAVAKLEVVNYVKARYKALPESLRNSISWEVFYIGELEILHRAAVNSRVKFPTMPKRA
jgi:hypothetical protein